MYRKPFQFALLALALGMFQSAAADDYWIVGSFGRESDAESEAQRLDRLVGIPITIEQAEADGRTRYRLITAYPADAEVRENLLKVMKLVGVKEPWRITRSTPVEGPVAPEPPVIEAVETPEMPVEAGMSEAPEAAEMPETGEQGMDETVATLSTPQAMPDNPVFLIVGSFTDFEAAVDLERRLEQKFAGISSRSTFMDGRLYHRVLLGPISEADKMSVMASLEQEGITDVTEITPEEAGFSAADDMEAMDRRPGQSAQERLPDTEDTSPKADGYNPAKLKLPTRRF